MVQPRLVLVHGTRMTSAQWSRYPALLPGVELVAPDLPGHGERTGEVFSTDAAVAVIAAAVAGAAPGQPVVLAGHSLGGYMAMVYASRQPHALAGLVLIGSSAVAKGPGAALYRGFARLLPVVGYDRMARFTNGVVRRLGGEAAGELPGGESYAATAAAWEAVMTDCGPELLREVDCPVVLVNGQFDQMRAHVSLFARECRSVRVVTVPRVTHLMPLTHPELVADVLAQAVEGAQPETRAG